jgi:P27 family predicted phage terminase small subunit
MASDWRKTCADLIGRELLTDAMLPMVETYVGALWMARKCREAIEQHGVLVGTKGGDAVKPNPAAAMLAKAQEIVARLGDDLGISAVARNRPGIRAAEKSPHDDDAAALGL